MSRRIALVLLAIALLLCRSGLFAQQSGSGNPAPSPPSASALFFAPAPPLDRIQQMRADLNQMESLMNNMSSEITFLRDQNLQILLNTNVRMWTILIRDLRRQLDEEQSPGLRPLEPPPQKPKSARPK